MRKLMSIFKRENWVLKGVKIGELKIFIECCILRGWKSKKGGFEMTGEYLWWWKYPQERNGYYLQLNTILWLV